MSSIVPSPSSRLQLATSDVVSTSGASEAGFGGDRAQRRARDSIRGCFRVRVCAAQARVEAANHLGSPRMVVDVDNPANKLLEARYSAFGIPSVVNGTGSLSAIPFGFAGGLYDADTGLVRFGARDYDARFGRWTHKDPILFDGGTNVYVYATNDPINFRDPNGKESCEVQLSATVTMCEVTCSAVPDYSPSIWEEVKLFCGSYDAQLQTRLEIWEKRRTHQETRTRCLSHCREMQLAGKAQCDAQEPDGMFGACSGSGCLVKL
jgi:RHS repeat-associated protein